MASRKLSRFIFLTLALQSSPSVAQLEICTGVFAEIGNGVCDSYNNGPSCDYDGGDCCICTCDGLCVMNVGDDCLDSSAGNELYGCEEQTTTVPPCSSEVQQSWVVDGSAQAQALAEAANCSGGTFDVEWEGDIAISKSIYVIDGTVLNVTGIGYGAGIDGDSNTRLFTVINASLHLTNLSLKSGSAIVGGAIAASGSRLVLSNVSFVDNEAIGLGAVGGAMFVTNGSSVVFDGGSSVFSSNTAVSDGGALYVTGNSVLSFSASMTSFTNNTAGGVGGALAVRTGSQLFGDGEAVFSENICTSLGGAIDITGGVNAIWTGVISFFNNTAESGAGALMIRDMSNFELFGQTTFTQNSANNYGGTVFVGTGSRVFWSRETTFTGNFGAMFGALIVAIDATASWSGKTTFIGNVADGFGGALAVTGGSNVSWSGPTTFIENHCYIGGAVYVTHGSSISWSDQTTFDGNIADSDGGALVFTLRSSGSWSGPTTFTNNHARSIADLGGGALLVYSHSSISWSGPTTFMGNKGYYGGALYANNGSSIFWTGRTIFVNNDAIFGGALCAFNQSSVSWSGYTTIANNTARVLAGAFYIVTSSTLWNGPTEFLNNSITSSNGSAGAVFAHDSSVGWSDSVWFSANRAPYVGAFRALNSNISWSGETEFSSNHADGIHGLASAGALNLMETNLEWSGKTLFFNNSANVVGGALVIGRDSNVSWRGETSFTKNRASYGGAIAVNLGNVSWSESTGFLDNSAYYGGGIFINNRSSASWAGETTFLRNTAEFGGGLFIVDEVVVHWTGQTTFVANEADFEGGGIKSTAEPGDEPSTLIVAGPTMFANNTSGANGGALSLLSGLSVTLETADVVFSGNSALLLGGAVFFSGADIGLRFQGVRFESNTAQIGGAVYATSSGNKKINVNGVETQNPTVFDNCTFIGNKAEATGGAVQTAAGSDIFFNTMFVRNIARVGGALRLAGTAEIESCLFEDNVSDESGGVAVSNIGYISSMAGNSFVGNTLACSPGTFLDNNESNNLYQVICDGCNTPCEECLFDNPTLVPICTGVMDHSVSPGGLTTLEGLSIDPHYWRATNSSIIILECYNPDACRGGLSGSVNYCLEGYEGPYCAICGDGYTASIGYSCEECLDNVDGVILAVFLAAVGVVIAVTVAWYLVMSEADDTKHGLVQRLMEYIPLQSLKTIIVVWQILTQFASVANVTYPNVYQRFLDGINVLNFDLAWILSAGCIVDFDFHDRLLFSTIGPIIIVALLAATYIIALRRNRESESGLESVRHKHLSALLLLTFLVYSSVSSILFQTFACEHLDDGKHYLRADYRIECDSLKHEALQVYTGFMIVLYPLGIPALYAALLFKDREVLRKREAIRKKGSSVLTTSSLWEPYKPSVFYYEVIECGRRILLTGVVVFIYPNTAAQIAVTLILTFAFATITEVFNPYMSIWNTWISRTGYIVVFVSIYIALLLKVDVTGERAESQKTFEVVLVSVHGSLIAAVLAEAFVLAKTVTVDDRERKGPLCRMDAFKRNKSSPLVIVDQHSSNGDQVLHSPIPDASEVKV